MPWHEITGMRNRLVHDYFNVNLDILWDVVTSDLPPLVAALASVLPSDPDAIVDDPSDRSSNDDAS